MNRDPMSDDTMPDDATPDELSAAETEATTEIGADQLKEIIEALQAELDTKTTAVADKHDQYVRAVAEGENVRRRLEREKDEIAKYAISKFAKDILSVGDNFQRAIAAVPKDAVETDPALKTLLEGVVLAERDFRVALERHGVKTIDPAGQPFNPHHHQAVMEQENPDVPNGTVLQVFQVGYLIDDRCLRPAMVVVSRGGGKTGRPADAAPPADETAPSADDGEPQA
jgi:molecular chaperone GrpE